MGENVIKTVDVMERENSLYAFHIWLDLNKGGLLVSPYIEGGGFIIKESLFNHFFFFISWTVEEKLSLVFM